MLPKYFTAIFKRLSHVIEIKLIILNLKFLSFCNFCSKIPKNLLVEKEFFGRQLLRKKLKVYFLDLNLGSLYLLLKFIISELTEAIDNLYATAEMNLCQKLSDLLHEKDFDTPSIRASLLKNFIHSLPEPLCLAGYSKYFVFISKVENLISTFFRTELRCQNMKKNFIYSICFSSSCLDLINSLWCKSYIYSRNE